MEKMGLFLLSDIQKLDGLFCLALFHILNMFSVCLLPWNVDRPRLM